LDFLSHNKRKKYKQAYGVEGKTLGGKIGQATEPILNSIFGQKLEKSIVYYTQKYKRRRNRVRHNFAFGRNSKTPRNRSIFANNSG